MTSVYENMLDLINQEIIIKTIMRYHFLSIGLSKRGENVWSSKYVDKRIFSYDII